LAKGIGLRLDEAMLYVQVDEIVLLCPQTRQTDPTKNTTEYFFHPVDNIKANYKFVW